ncbi:MAG TPA: AAA family ATPase [Fimbriimonadaceae bacterium]|nr:AAA family ATPase [Fimbriimonadaceae bacterium]
MDSPPIFLITGSPATGKSSVSRELMRRYPRGVHIELDAVREWVVSGISHPIDWCEETTAQFELAEDVATDAARRYQGAGFAVALDHCTMPFRLRAWLERGLAELHPRRIVLTCHLSENLERNRLREIKDFDYSILEPYLPQLNEAFVKETWPGWHVLDTTCLTLEETVKRISI